MSGIIKFSKVVNALPDPLEKNTIYFVKTGASVLAYVTNDLGLVVSYPLTVDLSTKADLLHSHDAATESVDGFMSAADKTKLNTVASGATANASDATLLNRANHTGSQPTSTVTGLDAALAGKASTDVATTTVNGLMSSTDKTKLNGVATGATANATDATLLDRANHTGSQAISTITNLQTSLDAKVTDGINIKRIHVGTTPPGDTTMLWIDTN